MHSLFEETTIGTIPVKNHFLSSATIDGKATNIGYPKYPIKTHYKELCKGQVGTIITSPTYITDYEQPAKNQLGIYHDGMIGAYKNLVAMVHDYDSKIVMQLVHGSSPGQAYPDKARLLGHSAITHPPSGLLPTEMTQEDMTAVVDSFVRAARRVKLAGFDGVQIHCAQGYLLSQFISPLFNHRTDNYGGSVENRLRFVLDIYHGIRQEVGADYPVWIKINCSDEEPGGLSVEDFIQIDRKSVV